MKIRVPITLEQLEEGKQYDIDVRSLSGIIMNYINNATYKFYPQTFTCNFGFENINKESVYLTLQEVEYLIKEKKITR